ncbi:MAG: zinc ABC transporter substrate-binding protein [Thiogranum sp.]|jgi:zinc/manganese transport system substrate-binding protein|nr:zinc ABC transporter substrate-binding protein [Thiogranum sp.]
MNHKHLYAASLFVFTLLSPPLQAALRILACEPEWGALAQELGGDDVSVYTATTAHQDPHHIQARPSLIAQARRADLVVCTGAELEIGWLPLVLRRAGNPKIQTGTTGYFAATDFVALLEKPQRLDRAEGDVHAAGNPHIQLDPHNILRVAQALGPRLAELDSQHADQYAQRLKDFSQRWQAAMGRWETQAEPLKGMPIVVYHRAWTYLNHWLGLDQLAELEPRPGVPPTSSHLAEVLDKMKAQPARAVIRAPYQDQRPVQWLHDHTGIAMLELPFTVGGNAQAGDLFGLFDSTVQMLLGVQP